MLQTISTAGIPQDPVEAINARLKQNGKKPLTPETAAIVRAANVDPATGKSDFLDVSDPTYPHHLVPVQNNGSANLRGGSQLAKIFKIGIHYRNGVILVRNGGDGLDPVLKGGAEGITEKGDAIIGWCLDGYVDTPDHYRPAPAHIQKAMKVRECVFTGASNCEPDHKIASQRDPRYPKDRPLVMSDFQPLSPSMNKQKRGYCVNHCQGGERRRFDARTMAGIPIAFTEGDATFTEDLGCKGCILGGAEEFRRHPRMLLAMVANLPPEDAAAILAKITAALEAATD